MERTGCMCCPYPLVVIPGFLTFLAMIFTINAGFNCNFYHITADDGNATSLNIGLWSIQDINPDYQNVHVTNGSVFWNDQGEDTWEDEDKYECVPWNERSMLGPASMVELDGAMSAARVCGMLAALLGVIGFCLILVPFCFKFADSRNSGRIFLGFYVLIGVLTLLDLVALASDICKDAISCALDTAGILAIIASLFWFASGCLVFYAFQNPRTIRNSSSIANPLETVQSSAPAITQTDIRTVNNPDGSTTTVTRTTVTNPDGSKTVTERTEVTEPPSPPMEGSIPVAASVPVSASVLETEMTPVASVLSVVGDEENASTVPAKPAAP